MAESTYDKFRRLLAELFMFDRADLDFGIYRIMNAKRDEVTSFLDVDLLPQVKEALLEVDTGQRLALQQQLEEVEQACGVAGIDPDTSQKVQDLRAAVKATGDPDALEAEVFSHLYSFFRRYYKEGDFISLRRYKEGVYAIPYEGEEVKLYWANHDQYYIKSGEYFRDYAFKLPDGRRVHFKLAEADEERDNVKAAAGQERRFILCQHDPVCEVDGDLVIRFDYRPDPDKRKRDALIAEATEKILASDAAAPWLMSLSATAPTEKNPRRTLLEKHLNEYTARNTFDYFIHKDLGGFLRRELDFYIKNEVMHLDDIESEGEQRVAQYLTKIKAIRRIAHMIIDFLAQLEGFQKKLWLKKKFVIETNYLAALDQVPEELYAEVAANEPQRQEWVRLFSIDTIPGDLTQPGYSEPLTDSFLRAQPTLMVDTRHFGASFKERLLACLESLDDRTDGLLIHGENLQALSLLQHRFRNQVACVYIDPPYNTDASPILYKNGYRRSSWASLLADRLEADAPLHSPHAVTCIAIDDFEYPDLRGVLETLAYDPYEATVTVRSKPQGRPTTSGFSANHEYAVFLASSEARIGRLPRRGSKAERYPHNDELGAFAWSNFRKAGTDSDRSDRPKSFYPVYVSKSSIRIPAMSWCDARREWHVAEGPSDDEKAVWPCDQDSQEKVWTCSPKRASAEMADIRAEHDASGHVELYKKYRPNQGGALPGTWWDDPSYSASESGTKLLKDMFGAKEFDYPKSVPLVMDCLRVGGLGSEGVALDYFAGSGTTGQAVISLNREDGGRREFILVEMGDHFETVLLPRIKKVTYTPEWKDARPERPATSEEAARGPHLIKYIRLESYEDALNNLRFERTPAQTQLLASHPHLRQDYTLRYMLDVESVGSASLLDLEQFEDPFSYTLEIGQGSVGETRSMTVDVVETFNYLIGLRVRQVDTIRGFKVVEGTSLQGERVLVIWRNTREKSSAELDEFFQKQGYNTRDTEFDVVYVNGDNNLENLRRPDETWKVRLIEDDFKRLMFDVEDV